MPKKTSAPKKVLEAKQAEKDAKKNGKQMKGGNQAATKGSGIKAGEYRPG